MSCSGLVTAEVHDEGYRRAIIKKNNNKGDLLRLDTVQRIKMQVGESKRGQKQNATGKSFVLGK